MKALLVDIDLKVRIVVPDDATDEQIISAAAQKALNEILSDPTTLTQGVQGDWQPDTEVPFDSQTESNDGRPIVGYQIESSDGMHDTPPDVWSFEIFSTKKLAEKYIAQELLNPDKWIITTIFDGDIEGFTYIDQYVE